jgi:Ni,Fe-hydrogenase III large subunit
VRTVYAELERIHNLLGGISGISVDTALSVPAADGYMLKERMHRLNESITGHRLLWGALCLGGVRIDIGEQAAERIEAELMRIKLETDELFDTIVSSASFMDRAETTGILATKDAVRLRAVGPVARGSGIDNDVRKQHPYEAYNHIMMKVANHTGGDVYSRLKVKKNEISESISIIIQCLSNMDEGPVRSEITVKDGFSMGMVESPRGELIHCVHIVDGSIWRYKIRDASFPNWSALEHAVLGNIVPDFPLINKSFDLSYSGNDL